MTFEFFFVEQVMMSGLETIVEMIIQEKILILILKEMNFGILLLMKFVCFRRKFLMVQNFVSRADGTV